MGPDGREFCKPFFAFFLFLSVDGKKCISRSTNDTTRGRPVLWRSCGANRARSAHKLLLLRFACCEEGIFLLTSGGSNSSRMYFFDLLARSSTNAAWCTAARYSMLSYFITIPSNGCRLF